MSAPSTALPSGPLTVPTKTGGVKLQDVRREIHRVGMPPGAGHALQQLHGDAVGQGEGGDRDPVRSEAVGESSAGDAEDATVTVFFFGATPGGAVQANIDVNGMGAAQKVQLADEIFAKQPNLLASILALPRMGVGMVELEVPLHILFVTFQAMKRSGHVWPIVSEDVQDRCMQRLTARARFNDGLPKDLADQMIHQFCDEHPERYLLAFVYGHLGDHDLMQVRTDAEKYLMMAALNLLECLAAVGTRAAS